MDAGYVQVRRGPSVAGKDSIRVLAEAAVFGLPVDRMLRSGDGDEVAMYEAIRCEAVYVIDDLMTNLARKIVKEQADAQNRAK